MNHTEAQISVSYDLTVAQAGNASDYAEEAWIHLAHGLDQTDWTAVIRSLDDAIRCATNARNHAQQALALQDRQ